MKRKRSQYHAESHHSNNVINMEHTKRKKIQIFPKNINQEIYLEKLNDQQKRILFAIGPAGTGKTLLAVQWAIDEFKSGSVSKIIVTRPAVSVDEEHGFLPGDLNEKMAPWTRPIFDVLQDNFHAQQIENFIKEGQIETSPLAYMRGRTFKDAIIIADECQLCTVNQMKMLLTRLGDRSKMIVTGDLAQADRGNDNGMHDFIQRIKSNNKLSYIDIVEFTHNDIERHPAVSEVLKVYGEH